MNAEVAQLVERQLPKLQVASSNLVFRSNSNFPKDLPSGVQNFREVFISHAIQPPTTPYSTATIHKFS